MIPDNTVEASDWLRGFLVHAWQQSAPARTGPVDYLLNWYQTEAQPSEQAILRDAVEHLARTQGRPTREDLVTLLPRVAELAADMGVATIADNVSGWIATDLFHREFREVGYMRHAQVILWQSLLSWNRSESLASLLIRDMRCNMCNSVCYTALVSISAEEALAAIPGLLSAHPKTWELLVSELFDTYPPAALLACRSGWERLFSSLASDENEWIFAETGEHGNAPGELVRFLDQHGIRVDRSADRQDLLLSVPGGSGLRVRPAVSRQAIETARRRAVENAQHEYEKTPLKIHTGTE